MSLASLENAIAREMKAVLKNPKATKKHLMEWSTSKDSVCENLNPEKEVYVYLPDLGIHAAVLKEADKR
jgi:hypothetical protein